MSNFSSALHRDASKRDTRIKEFAKRVREVFSRTVVLELYPRSDIEVHAQVLSNDGSFECAVFNAITLALTHAGIAMKSLLFSANAALFNSQLIVGRAGCSKFIP